MSNKQLIHQTQTPDEFYPTPENLIDKMLSCVDFKQIKTILEPSAGAGDIAEYTGHYNEQHRYYYANKGIDVDCIELDPKLQSVLRGAGHRVIHDDFLTFHTYKHYDAIIMNPPFSNGDEHLLKAIEIQKNGGQIICLLNAETLKNPYTNRRQLLLRELQRLNAEVQYISDGFKNADRKTGVEVALVNINIPRKQQDSSIFADLKKGREETKEKAETNQLTKSGFIEALVQQFKFEAEGCIRLIREYEAMKPYILRDFEKGSEKVYGNKALLTLSLECDENNYDQIVDVNKLMRKLRAKYWNALFENKLFMGMLTSNLKKDYMSKLDELQNYDFTEYNIKTIQLNMNKNTIKGVENAIIELFGYLSSDFSWYPESKNNIHYYNGWATNKAHRVNKKVIVPIDGFHSSYSWQKGEFDKRTVYAKISDLEKAFDYLGGTTPLGYDLDARLQTAELEMEFKKIQLKYFHITLYKKGTCHIVFTDEKLLEKLNIYGSQHKKWLPPNYGKAHYSEMSKQEKAVVDEFQGKEAYEKVMAEQQYYFTLSADTMLMLSAG